MASPTTSYEDGAWLPQQSEPLHRLRVGGCIAYFAALALLFIRQLSILAVYAAHNDLNSHILLVPFISGYLLYIHRGHLPATYRTSIAASAFTAVLAIAALSAAAAWSERLSTNDHAALIALAFAGFVASGGFFFLGSKWMAAAAFPMAFLIFLAPLPDAAVVWLENGFALASAKAAALFFNLTGTPMVRTGTMIELPGIALRVAQECSGIHSSWVLFITSLLASHLFLRTGWRRAVLVAFIIPLGILRNGFRILVIGLLCVHIGPQMIESPIHHRGGPLFFALSLVPLFLLACWLRHRERPLTLSG